MLLLVKQPLFATFLFWEGKPSEIFVHLMLAHSHSSIRSRLKMWWSFRLVFLLLIANSIKTAEPIEVSEEEIADFYDQIAIILEEAVSIVSDDETETNITATTDLSRDKRSPGGKFLGGLTKIIRGVTEPIGRGARSQRGALSVGAQQARLNAEQVRAEIRKVKKEQKKLFVVSLSNINFCSIFF